MYIWKELAEKFEELQQPLSHAFISVQWGNAGTHLYLKGINDGVAMSKFKNLAEMAGKKLDSLPNNAQESFPDVLEESNHYRRWLLMLWKHGPGIHGYQIAQEMKDDKVLGNIHTGNIRNPSQESANICMGLVEFDEEKEGWPKWLWNEYGKEILLAIIVILLTIWITGIFE